MHVMDWVALMVGRAVLMVTAIGVFTGVWWWALSRLRKCAYETYLMADMRRWMKTHAMPKDEQ